jgi:serine/threonine-protein kinase
MVMEFLVGSDLSHVLDRSGPLALEDAVDYVAQACEAIAEAHAHGIVHRDLKPANLFLTRRPDGSPLVKVLDFGISKMAGGGVENLTRTTAAMGSALYMSPEQMQQTRSVDHRTDIYALGISLFELIAGRQPFFADTLPQLCAEVLTGTPTPLAAFRPDLPASFAAVLAKAYARDRGQRYQTIAELVVALSPFAPPRTFTTIERIARMGGLPMADIGARRSYPSVPEAERRSYPGSIGAAGAQPPAVSAFAASAAFGADPRAGGTAPLPGQDGRWSPVPAAPGAEASQQIVPGHYNAPMSARAAASFASGTGMGLSTNGRLARAPSAAIVTAMVAGALLVGLGVGTLYLRRNHADETASAEPPQATASAPVATPIGEQLVPSAAPEATAPAASASAAASAAPAASASAAAVVAPPRGQAARPPAPRTPPPAPPQRPAHTIDLNDPH